MATSRRGARQCAQPNIRPRLRFAIDRIKRKLARPTGLALALFVAIAVVAVAQIVWWIYFQVTISREQLAFHERQAQASAELAAAILNRSYARLEREAASFVSVDNIRHLEAAFELLREDPAVIGYQLFDPEGGLLITSGAVDSTFYLDVRSSYRALVFLDAAYPAQLTSTVNADLQFAAARRGRYESPWFAPEMFSVQPQVLADVEERGRRRVFMFTMEGSFFVLLTLFGAFMIYRTLRQSEELKMQQENFIHAVTHELKIPLASIKLYLETMASGKFDQEKVKGFIPRMLDDCARLEGLVDNVLEAGRIGTRGHHANLVETNLATDLREYIEDLQPHLDRYQMQISAEIGPELPVRTDYHALRRVVTALVDNAIKYSPEHRRHLTITARRIGRAVEVAFADQGIGIERYEIKKVFDRFYRTGEESTRSVKGTGIGLFLVRQIVTEHGGAVEARSEGLDKGTTFIIKLPLVRRR